MADASNQVSLLGRIAVSAKLITQEQLMEGLRAQDHLGPAKHLGEIFLEYGWITQEQLAWLLEAQRTLLARQQQQAAAQAAHRAELMQRSEAPAQPAAPPERSIPLAVERPEPVPARPVARAQPIPVSPAVAPAAPAPRAPAAPAPRAPAAPAPRAPVLSGAEPALNAILSRAMEIQASDVHVHVGLPIQMRVAGRLMRGNSPALSAEQTEQLVLEILTAEERERFLAKNDLDFAYILPGVGRFRGNIFRQRKGIDAVFRPVPLEPPTLAQLGLPSTLARLTSFHQGLVLVTGPAGCGKSSTLAALINLINEDRPDHIITVEDPIEYVHRSKSCLVNQRQVARHTESFASALRAALREDPDVIAIGELRDLETISLAITAAETGHLVLGTLHTNDAARTINRILDAYPPDQQSQIRAMISESLRAIVSQRLLTTTDGTRRVPALEILLSSIAVANLIREERVFQLRSVMQTGRNMGMCLMDDSLLDLVKSGQITKEMARRHCEDQKLFL